MRYPCRNIAMVTFAALALCPVDALRADPCGMVPPVYVGEGVPIVRVGEQRTYVFYHKGIESFVIRPGFSGKVAEFGMLIPFPEPPTIRKVDDAIFEHLAKAIDPPEVVVDLRPQPTGGFGGMGGGAGFGGGGIGGFALAVPIDVVRVIREEAVGMYEVAVLAAGSAKALKRWVDDHGYKYPTGMDKTCEDYVKQRWCFVAVKTKVGRSSGADPKPAQRKVDTRLPSGATFDGRVQAMAFRFRSDSLVLPMRLSAFNAGELRNVVYLLTDAGMRIRSIPEEYVVRQVSGEQLYKNVTGPLPLRIIGGRVSDISKSRWRRLDKQRNPIPHNSLARDLFASDLLAVASGKLISPHEKREKQLLSIAERLGLRGGQIDKLNRGEVRQQRLEAVKSSLAGLKRMTLTVIDGDFPREVIARENLKFAAYRMSARRNRPMFYDAKNLGPAANKEGILKIGAIDHSQRSGPTLADADPRAAASQRSVSASIIASLLVVGLLIGWVSRRCVGHAPRAAINSRR